MKRSTLHFVVDLGLAAAGLVVLFTGLGLALVLPPGSRGSTVAGWTRHDWGDLHFYAALALLAAAAVHVTLHWNWVCNVLARLLGRRPAHPARPAARRLAGLALVLLLAAALAGLLLLASAVKVERTGGGGGGGGHGHRTSLRVAPPPWPAGGSVAVEARADGRR